MRPRQRRRARRGFATVGAIVERLKTSLKHGRNLVHEAARGNLICRENPVNKKTGYRGRALRESRLCARSPRRKRKRGKKRRASTSVTQPSSSMRFSSASG